MQAALFIAPPGLPLKPCKNLFQLQTFTPPKAGASLASRSSAIKATTAIADTTTVDCSSVISVFPAEACEIIGGDACLADMFQKDGYRLRRQEMKQLKLLQITLRESILCTTMQRRFSALRRVMISGENSAELNIRGESIRRDYMNIVQKN